MGLGSYHSPAPAGAVAVRLGREAIVADNKGPVQVTITIQAGGRLAGVETEVVEISRSTWDALDPDGRTKLLDEVADEALTNLVTVSWNIEDSADLATTS